MKKFLMACCFIVVLAWATGAMAQDANYTVKPGDLLSISVWKEPDLQKPAQVREEEFTPVAFKEAPKGLIDKIKTAAESIVKRVQKLIRPEKKIHKEIIINAETLETRVAVTEDGWQAFGDTGRGWNRAGT